MGKAKKLRKQSRKGEVLDEEEEVLRVLTVGMKPKKMHEVRVECIRASLSSPMFVYVCVSVGLGNYNIISENQGYYLNTTLL